MKHAKKISQAKKKRIKQKKRLKVLLILLVFAMAGAAITVYRDYHARPGFLEKIWISDRGADYITVAWERPRNVYKYVVTYNGETIKVSGRKKNVKITGLAEDTDYKITVRADSREREGFEALAAEAATKKFSHITGESSFTKAAYRPVDLKQTAETSITYVQGNGYKVNDDGRIIFTQPGKVTVTAKTEETEEYASVSKDITVNVLDTIDADIEGARPHIFYKLDTNNCERVKTINGIDDIIGPQSYAYSHNRYIVGYISKGDAAQRLIVFGDKKTIYEPKMSIGHANGMTIANGLCYSVRGGSSRTCISFDMENNNYGSFELPHYASGIAYDEEQKMFYTTQATCMVVYDSSFNIVDQFERIRHTKKDYCQDCGAYDGIMMHCVSGEGYKGTNYIDFYDVKNHKYLGSAECELSEVESIIVDDEGYVELLCNITGLNDYIWKTPINMNQLFE